jgi:hypothetical protein
VFHDGHLPVRLLTEELEDHADGPEVPFLAFPWA